MSTMKKYCSIINYLRHVDNDLYELLQDLCIGRNLMPKKGHGVTFLRPDKKLFAQIKQMAYGDNPEDAVHAINSLILTDNYESTSDFADGPMTHAKKQLIVKKASGSKVELESGGVISEDKEFAARGDRKNMSVYLISGVLPTVKEGAGHSRKHHGKKRVRGGADYGNTRQELFDRVLRSYKAMQESSNGKIYTLADDDKAMDNSCRDPALEVLVSLVQWLGNNKEDGVKKLICSLLSEDTLASLYIILRPNSNLKEIYLTDKLFSQWATDCSISSIETFSYVVDPVKRYTEYMAEGCKYQKDKCEEIKAAQITLVSEISRNSWKQKIEKFYEQNASNVRSGVSSDILLAEAELRVVSSLLYENSHKSMPSYEELKQMFNSMTLDKHCFLPDSSPSGDSGLNDVAFYYSTVYLMVRSDALLYMPSISDKSTSLIDMLKDSDDGKIVDLTCHMKLKARNVSDVVYQERLGQLLSNIDSDDIQKIKSHLDQRLAEKKPTLDRQQYEPPELRESPESP